MILGKRSTDKQLACLEFETEVGDRRQMHEAILHMGFHATVRIVKVRRKAIFGEHTMCLDEFELLGAFVEIERVIPPGQDSASIQADLDVLARSFGVPLERTTDTYDSLIHAAPASAFRSVV